MTLIAQGDRLMFWVNGEYVGQTQNTLVKQGKVGVVARNLEGSGCRVSFDNFELRMPLKVLAQQTPSMVAGQSVLAKAQEWKPVLADTFDSNVNEWPVEFYNKRFTPPDLLATAVIERGVYHPKQVNELKLLPFRGLAIPKQASTAKDVFVSVESRQHTVDEAWPPKYGLAFRVNESQDKYYAFVIDEVNGEFQLIVEDGSDASFFPPLAKGNSAAIRRGETNRLAVIAQGNLIKLFINDQLVTQVKDEQLTSGNAGIAFWGDWMRDYDVEFDNFQVRVP